MEIPKEIQEQIYEEMSKELDSISKKSNGKGKSLDEIEGDVLAIGNKFKKRLMEEALKYQVDSTEKKTVHDVKVKQKIEG